MSVATDLRRPRWPSRYACLRARTPALAQFGTIFGDPPRPPANVPSRPPSDTPYPQQYPQYPQEAPRAPPPPPISRGIQQQPLPPPPGVQQAPVETRRPPQPPPQQDLAVQPPPQTTPGLPPGTRQPRGTPQPANTAPQPGDEVIAEPPSQRIPNATAVFSGLDKITGRIISFDVAINETVQFGALQVVPRVCNTRPPTETQNTECVHRSERSHAAGRGAPHFHRLDVRLEPGPARGRASDLRYLDHRL